VAERAPAGAGLPGQVARALVAGAALLAYATSFAGGFQFDDWNVIVDEPRVQTLGAWWESLPAIRPLLKLTFALNLQSGMGLFGFHLVNVLVHAGAALAAMGVVARVERAGRGPGSGSVRWGEGEGQVPVAAALAALLFALHPIQTEAVTYLSGRSASLAGLLALASALAWLAGRERRRGTLVHGLSPLLFAAALLVKETAVALPPALLLLAAATGAGPGAGSGIGPGAGLRLASGPAWRAALRDSAVHWLLLAAAAAAYAASPTYRAMAAHAAALRPPGQNLLAHLDGMGWLAGQVARPWALVADPAWPAPDALSVRGAAAAALLAGLGWLGLHRAGAGLRPAGAAALWTLCWLPVTGWLLPRPEPASDRQLYLALLGPAWLAGRALAAGLASRWRSLAAGVAVAVALLLGGLTAARSLVYRDEVTFWAAAVAAAPGAPRPLNNLGLALSAACRLPEAEASFRAALEADPGHARARANLRLLTAGSPPGARRGEAARCPP